MDRSISTLLQLLSRNLLIHSEQFESFIPKSHHNTHYALTLLGSLSKLTQDSLPSMQDRPLQTPPPPPQKPTNPSKKDNQAIIQALMELRNSNQRMPRSSGIYSPILRAKKNETPSKT